MSKEVRFRADDKILPEGLNLDGLTKQSKSAVRQTGVEGQIFSRAHGNHKEF